MAATVRLYEDAVEFVQAMQNGTELLQEFFVPDFWATVMELTTEEREQLLELWRVLER